MKIDRVIDIVRNYKLTEMMTLGAGGIAGTVEDSNYDPNFTPPVGKRKKKPTILARRKFPGLRKRWSTGIV